MQIAQFFKVENKQSITQVESLAREIWEEYFQPKIGKEQTDYMLRTRQSSQAIEAQIKEGYDYYLIQDQTNAFIGYFCIQIQGETLFLSKLYLRASVRGKGFGKQALERVENIAKEHHCSSIWLTVYKQNHHSIKVYEKAGFSISGSLVMDIGNNFIMDDYRMEKSLT